MFSLRIHENWIKNLVNWKLEELKINLKYVQLLSLVDL